MIGSCDSCSPDDEAASDAPKSRPAPRRRSSLTTGTSTDRNAICGEEGETQTGADAPTSVPDFGRLLGLDYGTRRVGAAISTPEQNLASPLENYTLRSDRLDAEWLAQLAADYRAVGLVVGLPVHLRSGEEGEKAREARAFGEWAAAVTGLPATFHDERLTTATAELLLLEAGLSGKQRKARLDMLAAQIMLQSFLDRRAKPQA